MTQQKRKRRAVFGTRRKSKEEKKLAQQRYLRPRKTSIDVAEHLKTAALCMNRAFGEVGVTRQIMSLYEPGLNDEVLRRLGSITKKYAALEKLGEGDTDSIIKEIFSYIEHYSDNVTMLRSCIPFLQEVAMRHRTVRLKVVDAAVARVLAFAQRTQNEQGELLKAHLGLFFYALDYAPGWHLNVSAAWQDRLVDNFLVHGLGEALLQFGANGWKDVDNPTFVMALFMYNLDARRAGSLTPYQESLKMLMKEEFNRQEQIRFAEHRAALEQQRQQQVA